MPDPPWPQPMSGTAMPNKGVAAASSAGAVVVAGGVVVAGAADCGVIAATAPTSGAGAGGVVGAITAPSEGATDGGVLGTVVTHEAGMLNDAAALLLALQARTKGARMGHVLMGALMVALLGALMGNALWGGAGLPARTGGAFGGPIAGGPASDIGAAAGADFVVAPIASAADADAAAARPRSHELKGSRFARTLAAFTSNAMTAGSS